VRVEKSREHVDSITLNFVDPADSKKVDDAFLKRFLTELQILRAADGKKITFRMRGEVESDIRSKAVTQAKDTVQRRIDGLGVKEVSPTVRDEDIIIELPGDDDKAFKEIKDIISETARLEFKMVDDDANFFEPIQKSAKEDDLPKGLTFDIENAPVGKTASGDKKSKANTFVRLAKAEHEDMRDALKRLKEWVSTLQVDPDHEIGFGKWQQYNEEKDAIEDVGWRTYYLFSRAEVTGDMVRDARAEPDQSDKGLGGWHVRMELNARGGDIFEDITGRNVNRRFAIILDAKVESAPVIITKIPGGIATITMGSGNPEQQLQDSRKLELVLRSGALPAPISPSNEQRIGPSLGKDAIVQGGKGAVAGVILVLVFMVVYYSRAGMIANTAVMFNLMLQVAILAMIGASMTLPGIAGLTLTIGIAIDANVLINERIREELRHGKSPRAAVDVGYDKAFSAILDGHVTTLISALILAQYGTGPIKGFAVTLIFGIAASLFTGVVCTRLMFDWAVRHRKVKNLHLG
jgi:preprotein translocase subunit SecD